MDTLIVVPIGDHFIHLGTVREIRTFKDSPDRVDIIFDHQHTVSITDPDVEKFRAYLSELAIPL